MSRPVQDCRYHYFSARLVSVERLKRTRSLLYYGLAAQVRSEIESAQRIRRYAQELFPEFAAV